MGALCTPGQAWRSSAEEEVVPPIGFFGPLFPYTIRSLPRVEEVRTLVRPPSGTVPHLRKCLENSFETPVEMEAI